MFIGFYWLSQTPSHTFLNEAAFVCIGAFAMSLCGTPKINWLRDRFEGTFRRGRDKCNVSAKVSIHSKVMPYVESFAISHK